MNSKRDMDLDKGLVLTKRRQGAKLYLLSSMWSQACALTRYVLLARILGPEQLGLAAILILTASFFDLISDIGGDRFLIQDPQGDVAQVQSLVQLVLVCRGFLIAAALAIFAWPIAMFYKAPALGPALIVFGLSPLILGFTHLDLRRKQRDNDFRLEGYCSFISESASICVTIAAAFVCRDFTAVIWGIITRSIVFTLASHLFSDRPYRILNSSQHASRLFRFSFPLMVNGLILFLGGQGDRLVVGREIGFSGLGHYSAVILMIFYPSAVLQKYVHAIYLPMIAAVRSYREQRSHIEKALGSQTMLLSMGMMVGFAIIAPTATTLLYGARFTPTALVVTLIGGLQACRYLAVWPTTIALAAGRSTIVLANNLVRLVAWPAAYLGYELIHGLDGIVTGFVFGELTALSVAILLLYGSDRTLLFESLGRIGEFILVFAITVAWTQMFLHPHMLTITLLSVLSPLTFMLVFWSEYDAINDLSKELRRIVKKHLPNI